MSRILLRDNVTLCREDGSNVEFHIKAHIGSGASCVVYHAVCEDKTEHLLKEYYPRGLDLERTEDGVLIVPEHKQEVFDKGLERFRNGNERQKAVRLSENLKNFTSNVQGYFYGNGTEYIDMTVFAGRTYSNVENETLHDLMLRMRTLTQVIGYYHDTGLLHLDIKPDNIFVRPENETVEDVMLFDFDSVIEKNNKMTVPALSYTKDWAAPEQLLPYKRNSICEATDLFSIGEIIFTKIFGRHSTQAERRSFAEYDIDYNADIFKNVNPKVVPLIKELFRHTLCAVPTRRYQTAKELIEQLDKIVKLSDPKEPYLVSSNIQIQENLGTYLEEIEMIRDIVVDKSLVFISGGSDISSQMAKMYAQTFKEDYTTVIYVHYNGSLQALLKDDICINIINFETDYEGTEYLETKMKRLADLCDRRVLLIVSGLDTRNFNKIESRYFDYLISLKCDKIFTTPYDDWIYPMYKVGDFHKPFRNLKITTKITGLMSIILAMVSIGLPVISVETKGELVYGTLTFKGFNIHEVSLLGWLIIFVPIVWFWVAFSHHLKNSSKAMIICGTSVLGLIGWVEGLIACFSFCTNGEDMGWPWIEYGWAIGVLSYILVAIICYIHYIGIENMIRKAYHKYSMEDDFKTEIALQENSIYEKECEFSNVKEWCQAHMLEYFQVNLYSDNFYMAYYHNESLIGVIEYHCLEEGGIYLEMLEVCKQFRNLGYGRKIIENIQSNVDYIECIPKDSDVVYFYEKLGFVPCDNQCYIWYKQ